MDCIVFLGLIYTLVASFIHQHQLGKLDDGCECISYTHTNTHIHTHTHMDGWMDEWMDGLMDGRMDEWVDG